LVTLIDSLQGGMFMMVLEKLYVAELQKVSGNLERKICAVGLVKILTECQFLFASDANLKLWSTLLESLIGLFELPEDTSTQDDEHFVDVEDAPSYSGGFNELHSASKRDPDPFKGEIPSAKVYLGKNLEALSITMPNKVFNTNFVAIKIL
jgi:exportin-2 (importin alpha re-exporter)